MHSYLLLGGGQIDIHIPELSSLEKQIFEIAGIEDVRRLGKHIRMSTDSETVTILPNIDLSTEEAQNALLKIIEEPPTGRYFVLTAKSLDGLLDTIVSRCKVVRGELNKIIPIDANNFLDSSFSNRLSIISKLTSKKDALEFLTGVVGYLHKKVVENGSSDDYAANIVLTQDTLDKINSNANPYLQLLNYIIKLG